jgi:hypothetical protein
VEPGDPTDNSSSTYVRPPAVSVDEASTAEGYIKHQGQEPVQVKAFAPGKWVMDLGDWRESDSRWSGVSLGHVRQPPAIASEAYVTSVACINTDLTTSRHCEETPLLLVKQPPLLLLAPNILTVQRLLPPSSRTYALATSNTLIPFSEW